MKGKRSSRAVQQTTGKRRYRTYALMFVCASVLVSGVFFAARQHFSSMDLGMKNSKLRKQIDELQAEKRRLMLAKEVSLSPAELKKAAKKTRIGEPAVVQTEVSQVSTTTKEKAVPPATTAAGGAPLVVKTAMTAPSGAAITTVAKLEKPKPVEKRTPATE